MIYVDTSVVLAALLAEQRRPPLTLWRRALTSSQLLQYEVWTRLNARGLASSHGEGAGNLIGRIGLVELSPDVLSRALEPFPGSGGLGTLDALHLATCAYLQQEGLRISLATYDRRQWDAASAMGLALLDV